MGENYLNLSDEEIMGMTAPVAAPDDSGASAVEDQTNPTDEPVKSDSQDSLQTSEEVTNPEEDNQDSQATEEVSESPVDRILAGLSPEGEKTEEADEPAKEEDSSTDKKEEDTDSTGSKEKDKPAETDEANKDKQDSPKEGEDEEAPVMEHMTPEQILQKIMAPFKANGKTFEVKTPEEAIRLMQMGAGYGKKLHSIQQNLKVVKTLERAGIDQDTLSFLIDIKKGKKEAIHKLLKDSNFDPLDFNPDEEVEYTLTDHRVTDSELSFEQALEEIKEYPTGSETLRIINNSWDETSKDILFKQPELLGIMQSQRDNGIYSAITEEIERKKTLGIIPHNTPFLQAYKAVGDEMVAQGTLESHVRQHAPASTQEPTKQDIPSGSVAQPASPAVKQQPVASRVYAPKPSVINGDKARAAASTKTTSTRKQAPVNPLALSDEEFTKLLGQMNRF